MNYAILLAAGKGTRMKSELPKCGMSVLGKPMISYLVEQLKSTTIDEIICVVGYKKEFIYNILKDTVSYRIQLTQEGSGHAVNCCKDIDKSGYTIILNGDTPLIDRQLIQEIINFHLENKNDLTLGTFTKQNPYGYGRIIRDKNNKIIEILEQSELQEEQNDIKEVNSGIYCVKTNLLFEALDKVDNRNQKREYYLTDIVSKLQNYKIESYLIKEDYKAMGANTLTELAMIEDRLRLEIIKKHLENGVHFEGLQAVYISSDVIIEENVTIRNSTLLGKTIIHSGCRIEDSEITDSIIFNDSYVRHSVVSDSIIGKNCNIGPFSHVRNNSLICGDNRIGNFVEVKNSKIGISSKLSHLAYMGDTLCGKQVNFGCGSITVNYDGKQKYKTNIGDNVFIGCNTNLIAPIDIESNSFIAAGSTITNNLEQGDFAIARSPQITKKGYASKYE